MDEKPVTPDIEDKENNVDGCDVSVEEVTLDEDLPAAKGGVV